MFLTVYLIHFCLPWQWTGFNKTSVNLLSLDWIISKIFISWCNFSSLNKLLNFYKMLVEKFWFHINQKSMIRSIISKIIIFHRGRSKTFSLCLIPCIISSIPDDGSPHNSATIRWTTLISGNLCDSKCANMILKSLF